MTANSRLPELLKAERTGRVELLARSPAETRYWVVVNARLGGLRGWVAAGGHYVIDEPLEAWIDEAVIARWLASWAAGRGSFPVGTVFVEIGGRDGWLVVSAAETADILGQRCLHWSVALDPGEGRWLALPPLGCVLHDGAVVLDPLLGEARVAALLRQALGVLAGLATRLAAGVLAVETKEKRVSLPRSVIQTRAGQVLVNEWFSVHRK